MLLILEHSGTEKHTRIANNVKNRIEKWLGHTVQQTTGRNEDDIFLYDENFQTLGYFNSEPNLATLEFMIDLA